MSKTRVYCALSGFFFLLFATVISASAAPRLTTSSEIDEKFITYTDSRFDFSVQYPETWQIIPRDDTNPNALGGLVTFVPSNLTEQSRSIPEYQDPHDEVPQIVIGLYLAELEVNQSLYEWTEKYDAVSNDFDESLMIRQTRQVYRINKSPAVYESGISPLTPYQFTNLSHGKTVWFIWTNITPSQEDPYSTVYENIVKSFQFGENSPTRLKQVYGESFEPLKLSDTQSEENVNQSLALSNKWNPINSIPSSSILALGSSWKSPVLKQTNGNPRNVRCGSEAHNDNKNGTYSKYAADIGVSEYTNVYAAMGGTVSFAGWAFNGYGNLLTL